MAATMTKRGQQDNVITYEFICDTSADLQAIDKQYIVLGSTAIVLKGDVGFEVFMANSQKEWVNIGGGGNNNGGSSEPIWVNQDIIISVPETVSYEQNGETHYFATNMSLNNHVIQGNIVPIDVNISPLSGSFAANINPSLTTSFFSPNQMELESHQEYYMACASMPASMFNITDDTINTLIIPISTLDISATEEQNGDVVFDIFNIIDTLYIYKLPSYVCTSVWRSSDHALIHYLFSSLQPEAIYDISQLTYETPQVGE